MSGWTVSLLAGNQDETWRRKNAYSVYIYSCFFQIFKTVVLTSSRIATDNSRVKWSNLSTLVVIKNFKFIKESRQSAVKFNFPRTERNHHIVKIEKNLCNFEIIRKDTIWLEMKYGFFYGWYVNAINAITLSFFFWEHNNYSNYICNLSQFVWLISAWECGIVCNILSWQRSY